jgi:hypothetical protein
MPKYIKNLTDWLAESRAQKLIELGLAEPDDFFRLEYELNERLLKRVWEMIQGHTDADPMLSLGVPPIGKQWPVLKGSQSDVFYNASFNLPWPAHLVPVKIRSKAKRLTLNEFLDWIDAQVMDHIVNTWHTPTGWTEGQIIVRSTRTGKVKEVLDPVQESSGAARLLALGLINPEETDRIEYNINRYALENAYESLRYRGYVPSHKLDAPFFFIYGGRADGVSTGRPAGTRVSGLDFLTRDSFTGMSELSGDEFTAKITELFIDWLNTQSDEFFTKEIGLTGRPLLVRDETDALLGMQDWTPLMESQTDGFSTLLSLGLIDPVSEPRVEYGISNWFINFIVDNAKIDDKEVIKNLWREVKKSMMSRIVIYNGGEQISRWVSLMGYDIFDGLKDFRQLCSMNLDAAALKSLMDERIVKKIKSGFSTNWSTSPDPNPNPADERPPTLIKRMDDTRWKPLRLNESTNLDNRLKLMKLGLADPPPYIEYRISILPDLWPILSKPEEARTREESNRLVKLYISADIVHWRETQNGKHWAKGRLSLKDLLGPNHEVEIGDTEEDFRQWVEIRAFEVLSELAPNLDVPAELIREFGTDDWYSIDGSYLGNIDILKRS